MTPRIHRLEDADAVAGAAAQALLDRVAELQRSQEMVSICLSGGPLTDRLLAAVAARVPGSSLDPTGLDLWWSDDVFRPIDDPQRHSLSALQQLAGTFAMDPARIHSMPSRDTAVDITEAAYAHAVALDGHTFDVTLLEVGYDGSVAGLFPGVPIVGTQTPVIAVTQTPHGPTECLTLSAAELSRSAQVWLLAAGADRAPAVAAGVAGDASVPAGQVQGQERTVWFVDRGAGRDLPFHTCTL